MQFTLRPLRLPDDYARMAELQSTLLPAPVTAEELAEQDTKMPTSNRTGFDEAGLLTGYCRERVVAVDDGDAVIGYATSWRAPWGKPGELGSYLVVDPTARRHGVGSALAEHLIRWAREQGATRLMTQLKDNEPDSLRFAEQRGFTRAWHAFESTLDLAKFEEGSFADALEAAQSSGIQFLTFDGVPEKEILERLYELYAQTLPDEPRSGPVPAYAMWVEWYVAIGRPTSFLIAADGDSYVGVAQLNHFPETGEMYNEYTGVLREYRGRRIAQALKLLAVRFSQERGFGRIRTNNDSTNAPMLAINRKMGYSPEPGIYAMALGLR